jgi:Right handed beta helix region
MTRIIAKLFAVTLVLTAFLHAAPLQAAQAVSYVSSTGSGTACTAAQPCASIFTAHGPLVNGGQISCLNSPTLTSESENFFESDTSLVIDCVGVFAWESGGFGLEFSGANQVIKIRNLTFSGSGGMFPAVEVTGSGTLILENCVFENMAGTALDIEPTGPLNLVIRNSRISNNASGMLLKPAAGGSIKATFDHVVTTSNNGGGIKSDSTNGVVNLDISNSEISNNPGNGINLVGSANPNMLNLSRTVIAKNGVAGLQVNGATTAALVDTTLFDTNTSGATSVVGGGHVLTYGNNRIVGSAGSGFTGTAPSQ